MKKGTTQIASLMVSLLIGAAPALSKDVREESFTDSVGEGIKKTANIIKDKAHTAGRSLERAGQEAGMSIEESLAQREKEKNTQDEKNLEKRKTHLSEREKDLQARKGKIAHEKGQEQAEEKRREAENNTLKGYQDQAEQYAAKAKAYERQIAAQRVVRDEQKR